MPDNSALRATSNGPKYKRIYRKLRDGLADGTYAQGSKLPSENELVSSFGASRPTVRRALAELESEALIERRMGSGTFASRRPDNPGKVFGLLIPELGMTEIFDPICQGISHSHADSQHDLLWGTTSSSGIGKEHQAQHLCQYYIDRRVSGVFFAPMEFIPSQDEMNRSITRALDEAAIPVVLLDRDVSQFPERSKYDLVGIDNHRAGYKLTEHLAVSGCRRIAFLARTNSAHTVHARIRGYHAALLAHFGAQAEPLVKWADAADIDEVRAFLNLARPDAILCANDYTAAQLLTTLNSLGVLVPSEIRVAGMDDVKYARLLQTPLTTIHQPCQELGATALQAMMNRIARPDAPARDYIVDFQLVIRKSSDARPHKPSEADLPNSESNSESGTILEN